MNDTEIVSAYLDQLVEELRDPEIPKNGITVKMLEERTPKTEKTCRALLEKKVKEGKMKFVFVRHVKWYYPVE